MFDSKKVTNKILTALSLGMALFSCKQEPTIPERPSGWEILATPVEASLRGLSAVTSEIAWASGSGGTWLRTIDEGKTWDHGVIAGLDTVDFRSIHAFDALTAIAVSAGQPAVIYKTSDGGQTWVLKHQESAKAFLDGISFADEKRGYVFGDPVDGKWMILQTFNQGESWYPISQLPEAAEGEAGFAASGSSFLAEGNNLWLGSGGKESNLYQSTDGGKTWDKFSSPLMQGEASQGIFSLASIGAGEILCVGGDYTLLDSTARNAGLFLSEGKEWVAIQKSPSGYRSGVIYFPRFKWVLAVGPEGSDFSADGGITWSGFSTEGFHSIRLGHAEGSVWASGSNGKIGRLNF